MEAVVSQTVAAQTRWRWMDTIVQVGGAGICHGDRC